jgi:toxin ParE1/3/4
MAQIKWTNQAIEDIDNIASYIAKESLKYAQWQVERFFTAIEILENNINAGRIVPEINNKAIRELIIGNYRLIYLIKSKNKIEILTVHHSSRLLSNNPTFLVNED